MATTVNPTAPTNEIAAPANTNAPSTLQAPAQTMAPGASSDQEIQTSNAQQSSASSAPKQQIADQSKSFGRREMMGKNDSFQQHGRSMRSEMQQIPRENTDSDRDFNYHGEFAAWIVLMFVLATATGTAIVWSTWNGLEKLRQKCRERCERKAAARAEADRK